MAAMVASSTPVGWNSIYKLDEGHGWASERLRYPGYHHDRGTSVLLNVKSALSI